ncbi:DUF4105 domain-containing protein [Leptospira biflexa]|uniref:Lnb N-terminal periplasmic domain-containing protein n=1 Tax=Leptospira biflexa TaxID=172 RepID=UPI00109141F6|nr:DUF4105 domain-containing protein [Leptospira biflexa]TGM55174.1 DUF4105 domain-containing protein [Leptospira biflexa]
MPWKKWEIGRIVFFGIYLNVSIFDILANPKPVWEREAKSMKVWGGHTPTNESDQILLQSLLDQLSVRRLGFHPEWLGLLHYKLVGKDTYKSQVKGALFFFHKEGDTNPTKELEATLRSFFLVTPIPEGQMHPICSFPARYQFVKRMFGVDLQHKNGIRCERFEHWKESLNVDSVSIVFASYYMMAPASVFGHTMVKFNQKSNSENDSEILDYAVNVAADVPETDPFRYAFYGLFGGYKAKYTLFPYYLKVNEYNDLENRDLWEYRLSLKQNELDLLVAHLWELSRGEFDYYFLNANCGTFLVELLDVVKPELKLKSRLGAVVSPVDTIKIYTNTDGLVVSEKYRPSLYSEIVNLVKEMDPEEKKVFWKILEDHPNQTLDFTSLEPEEKKIRTALVLDAYLLTNRYQKSKSQNLTESQNINFQKALEARSKFPSVYETVIPKEIPTPPEGSHPKSRVSLGGGSSNFGNFLEWKYRFAYHDLLNQTKGSPPNSELVFFDAALRQYEGKRLEFTSFTLVRLVSLTPYNAISKHWSYLLDLGIQTALIKNRQNVWFREGMGIEEKPWQRKQVPNLDVAFGWTFSDEFSKTKERWGSLSFLMGFKSQFHPFWDFGGRYGPNVQTIYQKEWRNWKLLGGIQFQHYVSQTSENVLLSSISLRYLFSDVSELRLEMKQDPVYQEANGSFLYLF